MNGLALEGGGVKGAYHVGAYMAFKKCNVNFSVICGTSIGAFNAAMLASGKDRELLRVWQTLDVAEHFGLEDKLKELIVDKKFSLKLVGESFKALKLILSSKGIKLDSLKKLLEDNIDEQLLRESSIDFGCVTVRLKDLKPLQVFKRDIPPGKLHEYLVASSYLPVFKSEKIIDDNYYIDGGFYDNLPINMVASTGCKKIYAIRLNSMGLIKKVKDIDAELIYIIPKRDLGGILELNSDITKENIFMGYYDTLRVLKHYDGEHYVFKEKNEDYYYRLLRDIPIREKKRVENFLKSTSNKETVIKALEYILKKEGISYYQVLKSRRIIKKIKKVYHNNHFVYEFINKIKLPIFEIF